MPTVPQFGGADRILKLLKIKKEDHWQKCGEKMVLDLFHDMAKRVPAYKDFLKKNKINPNKIKTIQDFKQVPLISKESYLKKYPLEKLCWDGKFSSGQWDISSTSGSTGEPFYFPRTDIQNRQYALTAELYLRSNFSIHKKTTLYVNCFALGVWIGGLFTYEAIKIVSRTGKYKLTLINPGLNKQEIIKAIKNLGNKFDQVIIGGYPPFVKDVIDDGAGQGLKWAGYNLKFVFSAEAFSESFRDYITKKSGMKNIFTDSLNHYGTVDQGTLAHETPLAILIRRLVLKNKDLYSKIFGSGNFNLPTLAQYHPEVFYFEEVDEGVVCSSYSGVPLVRYDLKDHGGVISFKRMQEIFSECKIDLRKEILKNKLQSTIWQLPFVFVYERKDMSVSFCGANIYPETIKRILYQPEFLSTLTGKFVLLIARDDHQDPYLEINIELKNQIAEPSADEKNKILNLIVEKLLLENSEYRSVYNDQKQEKAIPKLVFCPYEYPKYFGVGGKQKWIIKN